MAIEPLATLDNLLKTIDAATAIYGRLVGWTLMGDVNTTVEDCVTAFYNGAPGEPHYEAVMSTSYTKVGCGVFVQGSKITITQDFGN